jgi:hypothetical protein
VDPTTCPYKKLEPNDTDPKGVEDDGGDDEDGCTRFWASDSRDWYKWILKL